MTVVDEKTRHHTSAATSREGSELRNTTRDKNE